jgi:hypothetical protein
MTRGFVGRDRRCRRFPSTRAARPLNLNRTPVGGDSRGLVDPVGEHARALEPVRRNATASPNAGPRDMPEPRNLDSTLLCEQLNLLIWPFWGLYLSCDCLFILYIGLFI